MDGDPCRQWESGADEKRAVNRLVYGGFRRGFSMAGSMTADPNRAIAKIDRLVFSKLNELRIPLSRSCTDEVFLRRIYLDMTGTLPTPQQPCEFLSANSANKRAKLIEELFVRDEFADYWAMKWCDLLRVKAEFSSNLWPNAVQAYHRWIRTAIYNNMPYDEFAPTLLTSSGSNFRVGSVNFYRAVPKREGEEIAQVVAVVKKGQVETRYPAPVILIEIVEPSQ